MTRQPLCARPPFGSGFRARLLMALCLALPGVHGAASVARAADLPISGIYGTVAMCVIDAFSDIPPGDVNFSAGGAPLAHVLPGEFDTPRESCAFQRIVSHSESGQKQSWIVEANCTGGAGNAVRQLQITNDKSARTITVGVNDKVLETLDQCGVPYPERLARELKRMPPSPKK